MDNKNLIEAATEMLKYSYSPYSEFCVGAALLTQDGEIYTGCNIENASFSATVCAERTAIMKAVSNGKKNFSKIAIVGGKNGKITNFCFPCGVCLQVMSEFCKPDFKIIVFNGSDIAEYSLSQLLAHGFRGDCICK